MIKFLLSLQSIHSATQFYFIFLMRVSFLWLRCVCGLTGKSSQNCGQVAQKTLKRKGPLAPVQEATTQRRPLVQNLPVMRH